MLRQTLIVAVVYLVVAAILHWQVFPEPPISKSLGPKAGDVLINKRAGEEIRFIQVGETTVLRVRFTVGGAIPAVHIHSRSRETFRCITGQVVLQHEGRDLTLVAGQSAVVEAGASHAARNSSSGSSVMEVTIENAADMNLALVQIHRYLAVTEHGPIARFLQMLRFADRYDIYLGEIPVALQQLGIAILSPSARLSGFRSFYLPSVSPPNNRAAEGARQ